MMLIYEQTFCQKLNISSSLCHNLNPRRRQRCIAIFSYFIAIFSYFIAIFSYFIAIFHISLPYFHISLPYFLFHCHISYFIAIFSYFIAIFSYFMFQNIHLCAITRLLVDDRDVLPSKELDQLSHCHCLEVVAEVFKI